MPFDESFDDIYNLGIKAACKDQGIYCERVDEQIFTESIVDRIYNQISKADIIIADMTGRNPNVFYEVGYAHALGKRVILLTQKSEDIPFDLKHYPHIIYGKKITNLIDELNARIAFFMNEDEDVFKKVVDALDIYVLGQSLQQNEKVALKNLNMNGYSLIYGLPIEIGIQNSSSEVFEEDINIELLTNSMFVKNNNETFTSFKIPNNLTAHTASFKLKVFPNSWFPIKMILKEEEGVSNFLLDGGTVHEFSLKISSKYFRKEFQFVVDFGGSAKW